MTRKHTGRVALLLVGLYAAAIGHQVLPHGDAHGDGSSCALCLLLASVSLSVGIFILLLLDAPWIPNILGSPVRRRYGGAWRLPFVRGPPVAPL